MASQVEGASPTSPCVGLYKGDLNPSEYRHISGNDYSRISIVLPIFLSCDNPSFAKTELERIAKFTYFNPGKEHDKKILISDFGSSEFRSYCTALNMSFVGGSVVSFIPQVSFGGDFKEDEKQHFAKVFNRSHVMNLCNWKGHSLFLTWFSQIGSVGGLIGETDTTKIEKWATETSKIILTACHGGSVPGYKQVSKPFDFKLEYFIFDGGVMSKIWNDSQNP
ncbi:uncharacterized protein FFFS_15782 [Fusarium fujikuroi]|nr:uncharacterized protein FFFS_15782 [Fusarium fujikuroi]